MANEIQVSSGIRVLKNGLEFSVPSKTYSVTMNGTGGPTPGNVSIGTTEESITFSELGTLGLLSMRNTDATNYVQFGFSTGVYGGRLKPNEPPAQFRLEPGATLYLKANTATCKVLVYGLED